MFMNLLVSIKKVHFEQGSLHSYLVGDCLPDIATCKASKNTTYLIAYHLLTFPQIHLSERSSRSRYLSLPSTPGVSMASPTSLSEAASSMFLFTAITGITSSVSTPQLVASTLATNASGSGDLGGSIYGVVCKSFNNCSVTFYRPRVSVFAPGRSAILIDYIVYLISVTEKRTSLSIHEHNLRTRKNLPHTISYTKRHQEPSLELSPFLISSYLLIILYYL